MRSTELFSDVHSRKIAILVFITLLIISLFMPNPKEEYPYEFTQKIVPTGTTDGVVCSYEVWETKVYSESDFYIIGDNIIDESSWKIIQTVNNCK